MKQSHFFAHLSRLKLINRWPLMRNVRTENVSEHSLQVAMVAHALAAIKNRKFGGNVNAVSLYWRCTTMPQKCSPAISLLR
jgi:5'-deoxynucleotidase